MAVHSATLPSLALDMSSHQLADALPFQAGDPEWVADLLETFRSGDLDAVINELDSLLSLMRKASKARRMLASVEPDLLREGLLLATSRRSDAS